MLDRLPTRMLVVAAFRWLQTFFRSTQWCPSKASTALKMHRLLQRASCCNSCKDQTLPSGRVAHQSSFCIRVLTTELIYWGQRLICANTLFQGHKHGIQLLPWGARGNQFNYKKFKFALRFHQNSWFLPKQNQQQQRCNKSVLEA